MSFKKLICLFTLTDEDVLKQCGRYDHYVIYSTFIRQVISLLFTFCIVLFGMSSLPNVQPWQALTVTALLSMTLFMVDQAIIGSEWSIYRNYIQNRFFNGILSMFMLIVRFAPRIIYSVIIAVGLATLAEIVIQSDYIDKELQIETKQLNADFFSKREAKEKELASELEAKVLEVGALESAIQIKKESGGADDLDALDSLIARLRTEFRENQSDLLSTKRQLEKLRLETEKNQIEVENLSKQIASNKEQREKECTDILRGAKCGQRAEGFRQNIVKYEIELSQKEPSLIRSQNELAAIEKKFARVKISSDEIENELSQNVKRLATLQNDSRSINEIQEQIDREKANLADLRLSKAQKLKDEELLLQSGGLKFDAEYGLLSRYVGLKKLHENEEIGEAAKEFSLMIKLVIVLIELSAVIVAVFFSPFSFYHERMRVKKDMLETHEMGSVHRDHEYTNEVLDLLDQVAKNERKITDLTREIDIERDIRKENNLNGYEN